MIEVKENVYWLETPGAEQSDAAMQWFSDEVASRLNDSDVEVFKDVWNRPIKWIVESEKWTATVERVYRDADKGMWAKKKDIITIKGK